LTSQEFPIVIDQYQKVDNPFGEVLYRMLI